MRTVPTVALAVIGTAEVAAAISRNDQRTRAYRDALRRASETRKPLLVIGDPGAGAWTGVFPAYDCGDVCLDLHGCPTCPVHVTADVTKPLPFEPDSHVVFVSCVLEYVQDYNAAMSEIVRVAGSPDDLFVASVQPWTLTAALHPGARWTVQPDLGAEPVSTRRKVLSVAVVGGLAVWALWPRR